MRTALPQHLLLVVVLAVAVVVVVAVLAVSGVFGGDDSQSVVTQVASATATASAEQGGSWPTKLAGTWVATQGTLSSRMVIAESGGQAKITNVMGNGVVRDWTFAGETLTLSTSEPNNVGWGPFGRTAASGPYTGTYVWTATNFYGSPLVTMHVGFSGDTLTMAMTNNRGMPGLTRTETLVISADGQKLSSDWHMGAAPVIYSRQ